ncbi:hypothetical protein ABEB36_012519 [Hypothenemus hampei]|uniref:Uncharacterized protein n=1 Tax=Hypothenemus hampei TaxID=57062 RepID=A0ABD1EBU7_HYPHA
MVVFRNDLLDWDTPENPHAINITIGTLVFANFEIKAEVLNQLRIFKRYIEVVGDPTPPSTSDSSDNN